MLKMPSLKEQMSGMAGSITEPELWQEFKALTIEAKKVTEANDDLRSGLFADIEAANLDEGEEEELNAQQEADLKKRHESMKSEK